MGKKVKKDDKAPPEDVFDPLLVESRQAATVVLMLASPEEEVLAKGCEAIYKFVEKCDENKKTLIELDCHEPLLRLVQHEDRIVRRNACMAIGVLAGHPDARRLLRKREETVPSMVQLLGPEEDTVVHEFAALCLSYLAVDFTSKANILDNDGMEPLVRCLSSSDPDVQKNAVETIALLLQDYQSRSVIRDLSGFPPLLELLRSDYPVIQHLALVALERATQDADNRAALRELEAINRMIDFVGKPEWSDLHVFAVMVLSNCLEDTETMEMIKENGGLQKLVAFITDTAPPEEEDSKKGAPGKGGKDKGGASRAGKKGGKGDDDGRRSSSSSARGRTLSAMNHRGGDGSIRGTPKPRRAGSVLRGRLRTSTRQQSVAKIGGVLDAIAGSPLLEVSESPRPTSRLQPPVPKRGGGGGGAARDEKKGRGEADPVIPTLPEVKEHAARAIARAAKNADNRKLLHEQEVEKMLILLLAHDDPNVQVAAANALGVMAENLISRESIGTWDGIEPLVKQLKHDNGDVREASSMCLANLTNSNSHNCQEVMRCHGADPLINLLSDSRELATANAAVVLTNMSPDEGIRSEIQRSGVVAALINPLSSTNTTVQSKVSLAVAAYVNDGESRTAFRENGGVSPLVALLKSGNDEVRRSSSWALTICAADEATAMEISEQGGLEILQEIQLSNTCKNAFTDVAMKKLLDSNLSAKYALMGYLSPTDFVKDGFYDSGCLREGATVASLEELCNRPVNQKRPVLLINAQPQKTEAPVQSIDADLQEKTSKSSVSGRNSRTGRDKTSRSRAAREKEEKQKEEEAAAAKEAEGTTEPQPFVPPGDNNLITYIDDILEKISPLPTTRDQVIALAQFVSDKLGGPIDRGQLANFSWELPLSQLKFELKSNVVPIGMIKAGIHYHRALLFKTLADRLALGSSLVRGEYNRAWNEVLLADDYEQAAGTPNDSSNIPSFPPKPYLVDLIHQPGQLLRSDSPDAVTYQKL